MTADNLNLKSSTIEKGLEIAKGFLEKIIYPPLEEVGLLLSDNVKIWRYKNQIRLLKNVESFVKKRNISTQKIPVKILLPLLEHSSLEEDPDLIKMWENLLINYIDSKKSFKNSIFPKVLAEISSDEAKFINSLFNYIHIGLKVKEVKDFKYEYESIFNNPALTKITRLELTNLIRLSILKETFSIKKLYKNFKGDSKYLKDEIHPTISFTEFGIEFLTICSRK